MFYKLARKGCSLSLLCPFNHLAGAKFVEIFIDCPLDLALDRNGRFCYCKLLCPLLSISAQRLGTSKVSESTIRKMAQIIEAPDPNKYSWEAHSMCTGILHDEALIRNFF
jgi:hypothetical protein